MYALYNIPNHSNCTNCGKCCGIVLVDKKEQAKIDEFVKSSSNARRVRRQKKPKDTCPYHDEHKKECAIYPARPIVCRLYGVIKELECHNGNSHNIDGYPFIKNLNQYEMELIK